MTHLYHELQTIKLVKTRKFFLRKSKIAYEHGDIYPIWGTCLGFEQMVVSIAQESILKPCQAKDKMSTLIPNWYWEHSEYISGKGSDRLHSEPM